ncbi:PhzF family phenazine biosynthesis protein [Glycomyces paridis]|uniref:PhzF family phenazine biosynthesis protein n=1 Tax=Glycomyces paridis TaxID=2126555 RepID=A0A4S8P2F8_9ACTN|nr:PhzF family phenazine biosynthesis protein [Glycomyces paridis]THV24270.1 PhzF family phenazine biosynthesis protein [Glycomyces paridis]
MLPFAIYDVFTDRPYAGNQLAVVHDGQALRSAQMQAIAKEFGFSETVFTLPPTVPGAHYRARIFTPAEELPFAGHPTVGAALAMTQSGRVVPDAGTVVQECAAGLMSLTVDASTAKLTSTVLSTGDPIDPAVAAAAIGLDPARVLGRPGFASAGYGHNFVRVADEDVTAATAHLTELEKVYPFSFDPATGEVHARLFHDGVGEDPATGSAALALGVHLAAEGLVRGDGVHRFAIAQGAEIGRPSRLLGEVAIEDGAAVSVSVTGAAAKVAEGTLVALPE